MTEPTNGSRPFQHAAKRAAISVLDAHEGAVSRAVDALAISYKRASDARTDDGRPVLSGEVCAEIDRHFGADVAIVSRAASGILRAPKAATAASITKLLRAPDAPAVRYATDTDVTGALYKCGFKPRDHKARKEHAARVSIEAQDRLASQAHAARARLDAIAVEFPRCKSRAQKRALRSEARAIAHEYGFRLPWHAEG